MTTFKFIRTSKTNAKPVNIWWQGLSTSFCLGIGTYISSFFLDISTVEILQRTFFQFLAVMTFCFIINSSYKLYRKEDKVEIETEIQEQVKEAEKEATFNF